MGIGNYLMGDEGVGVHIAQRMEKMQLPAWLEVLDGGTGGFSLMNYFDEHPVIIIVDATMDGKPAGTVSIIQPRFAADFPKALSVHDLGLKDLIEVVYLRDKIPEMHLVTISIDGIEPMTVSLSDEAEACIPEAIGAILELSERIAANHLSESL